MTQTMIRSLFLAGAVLALPAGAMAQDFPSKPIKMVVPFGPGAPSDAVTRFVTDRAAKILNTTFIVENKAGANGAIAAREVAKSAPDGYTIMVSSNSAHAANVYLYKDLAYDPVKDFAPITGLTKNPHVLVIRSALPPKTLSEFLAYGKANNGKLNYGAGNTGSLGNASLLMSIGGFEAVKATYKSMPPAIVDLLGDRIDFLSIDYFMVGEHIQSGKLRPLGVTSKERLNALPGAAPIADTIPGYELVGWIASFAPAGTPPDVVGKINKAFVEVITAPEGRAYLDKLGMISFPTTPAQLGEFVKGQIVQWRDVLSKAGVERE